MSNPKMRFALDVVRMRLCIITLRIDVARLNIHSNILYKWVNALTFETQMIGIQFDQLVDFSAKPTKANRFCDIPALKSVKRIYLCSHAKNGLRDGPTLAQSISSNRRRTSNGDTSSKIFGDKRQICNIVSAFGSNCYSFTRIENGINLCLRLCNKCIHNTQSKVHNPLDPNHKRR